MILFDLDGTLAESKSMMDSEMSGVLSDLLRARLVGVISGASYSQFENQFLKSLKADPKNLKNLYLFPTCSTSLYRFANGIWWQVYAENLTDDEKQQIFAAFEKAFRDTHYQHPDVVYGQVLEDRLTQITFSALGQEAPIELNSKWDPTTSRRAVLKEALAKYISQFEVRLGGATSLDVTRKGIDKAYGVRQIERLLGIKPEDILFIGDALFEGGNDYPVRAMGVDCLQVSGPSETKALVRYLIEERLGFTPGMLDYDAA